ncbi:hypothetical protein BDY21DRAFT_357252 [Lineolata rhizophorae]|uniref:Uncharacterized protein n=1 Tax=Lineolata rhizophorae TaxID=578093 RepID=A0A6A6NN61_9PEZI|nr:hypothetical protein BDY21DRAFT_357252 [Lineolata rhizophorae]
MVADDVIRLERSSVCDFDAPTQSLDIRRKRRRSSSAGADASTICQTPEPISEQNEAGSHSAKRRKLHSLRKSDCVPDRVSTPKLASPSRSVSEPQTPNTSNGSFVRDGSNDAGACVATTNSKHCPSDAESGAIDHESSQHDAPNERLDPASQPALFSGQSPSHQDGSEGRGKVGGGS